jgi:hypothetical protein
MIRVAMLPPRFFRVVAPPGSKANLLADPIGEPASSLDGAARADPA